MKYQKYDYMINHVVHFYPGLTSLNGKLYCIGGCLGQKSSNECHVYDPKTNEWDTIAPLNTGL
jgi:N-acetylneuraminic acid mutarotase